MGLERTSLNMALRERQVSAPFRDKAKCSKAAGTAFRKLRSLRRYNRSQGGYAMADDRDDS